MPDDQTTYGDYPGDSDYWVNAHRCVASCIHPCPVCPPGAHEDSGDGWCRVCGLSGAVVAEAVPGATDNDDIYHALAAHRATHGGE